MRPGRLLRIEWIKTTRRRAFWVALGFLAFVCALTLIGQLVQGRQGDGAPFVAPFAWAMTAAELGPMPAFFLSLVVVMLVTSEFSWRTARQNVIDGLSREQFFAAKLLTVLLTVTVFLSVPFTIATATASYGRVFGATPADTTAALTAAARDSAQIATALSTLQDANTATDAVATGRDTGGQAQTTDRATAAQQADSAQDALREAIRAVRALRPRPVYPAPDPDAPLLGLSELKVFGGFALGSLGFASLAFCLAIVLRSTGGAIGVLFLVFVFFEQVAGLLLRRFAGPETAQAIAQYMPVSAMTAPMNPNLWHPEHVERLNAIAASIGQAPVGADGDAFRTVAIALAWITALVGLAFLHFRRRDL